MKKIVAVLVFFAAVTGCAGCAVSEQGQSGSDTETEQAVSVGEQGLSVGGAETNAVYCDTHPQCQPYQCITDWQGNTQCGVAFDNCDALCGQPMIGAYCPPVSIGESLGCTSLCRPIADPIAAEMCRSACITNIRHTCIKGEEP